MKGRLHFDPDYDGPVRMRVLAEDLGRKAGQLGLTSALNPYLTASKALAEVWERARKDEISRQIQLKREDK